MSEAQDHVAFETLSNFADGILDAAERERVQRHVQSCTDCEERLARLRTLLGAASSLPAELEPPSHLWGDIRHRIVALSDDQTRSLPERVTVRPGRGARALWSARNPWLLGAAAVVLVAVSSAVTAALLRRPVVVAAQPAESIARTVPLSALPASARAIEADYARTLGELRETLELRRAGLDPATVVKVEASLRVIDQAIAEALRALADDPANLTLVDILSANYERKLELLRRAAELPSST